MSLRTWIFGSRGRDYQVRTPAGKKVRLEQLKAYNEHSRNDGGGMYYSDANLAPNDTEIADLKYELTVEVPRSNST